MEIKKLFSRIRLKAEEAIIIIDGESQLEPIVKFDITPAEFLEYAETDFQKNNVNYLVNSLTNSKRSIDCQLDKILSCFGINYFKIRIDKKFEIINSLGIATPRIIQKVRKQRNLLEHQYKKPTIEIVEDALDIAFLFIGATNYYIDMYPAHYYVSNKKQAQKYNGFLRSCFYCNFRDDKKLSIKFYNSKGPIDQAILDANHPLYIKFIRLGNLATRKKSIGETIQEMSSI